jgi:hypothetical protein
VGFGCARISNGVSDINGRHREPLLKEERQISKGLLPASRRAEAECRLGSDGASRRLAAAGCPPARGPAEPWTLDANKPTVHDAISIFGVERAMFASNVPVDELKGGWDYLYSCFKAAVADLPFADCRKLFADSAPLLPARLIAAPPSPNGL